MKLGENMSIKLHIIAPTHIFQDPKDPTVHVIEGIASWGAFYNRGCAFTYYHHHNISLMIIEKDSYIRGSSVMIRDCNDHSDLYDHTFNLWPLSYIKDQRWQLLTQEPSRRFCKDFPLRWLDWRHCLWKVAKILLKKERAPGSIPICRFSFSIYFSDFEYI